MGAYRLLLGKRSYSFEDLKEVLAKDPPHRSGDVLAEFAVTSTEEHVVAKYVLSRVLSEGPLVHFVEQLLVPYEHDEATRLILDTHDAGAFGRLSSYSLTLPSSCSTETYT